MEYNFSAGQPIWVQLTEILRERIVTGIYPAGGKLPTVRDFAVEFGVNPNTMQRALAQLETDGLVLTNRTVGRSVTLDAAVIRAMRLSLAQKKVRAYLDGMAQLGFSAAEAAQLLTDAPSLL